MVPAGLLEEVMTLFSQLSQVTFPFASFLMNLNEKVVSAGTLTCRNHSG